MALLDVQGSDVRKQVVCLEDVRQSLLVQVADFPGLTRLAIAGHGVSFVVGSSTIGDEFFAKEESQCSGFLRDSTLPNGKLQR